MFTIHSQIPSSTSLLLQCGYRSKLCTSPRATKIDGTLHKLCEFHRRKANLSQQRLHKRQREERARRRRLVTTTGDYSTKRVCPVVSPLDQIIINPIPFAATDAPTGTGIANKYSNDFYGVLPASTNFTPEEMDMLALLLVDIQPLEMQVSPPNSPATVDDNNVVIV